MQELIKRLRELQEAKSELNAQLKDIDGEIEVTQDRILAAMAQNGLSAIEAEGYKFTPTVTILPSSEDWDATFNYIKENDAFYLLYKRLSSSAVKEMLDEGMNIPGLKIHEKVTLSQRKAN
ncbi:MAG: hypothetical protein IE913_00275 [Halothiobacillus sp.]|nr:hypothetical protein [Halothiobacillus sp.]